MNVLSLCRLWCLSRTVNESCLTVQYFRGILQAPENGPPLRLEALVDEIESEPNSEPPCRGQAEIGELVLQQLKLLSEVAYVRFASVYRQFQGN